MGRPAGCVIYGGGVKSCLHTHSGNCLALNANALMHILRDFSPEQVVACLDPGHLALCGEPLPLAFDMAADWLAIVAIKDSIKVRREDGSVRSGFLPLGEGFVDWKQMLQWLIAHGYDGPLSFHSEFPSDRTEYLLEQTKKDIAYLRELERKVRGQA